MKRDWPGWMKRETVAAYCDCEPGYVDLLVKQGHLPQPAQVGAQAPRWRGDDVDAWLAGNTDSEAEFADPYDEVGNGAQTHARAS